MPLALLVAAVAAAAPPATLPVHGALLRADVDGDGRRDQVAVRCQPGSRAFLVVLTRTNTLIRRVSAGCGVAVEAAALARIDRVAGAEIIVSLGCGSACFARIYTLRDGKLVRLKIEGSVDDWFAYTGALTHDWSADCVRAASGVVVFSGWSWDSPWGTLTRQIMRVEGTRLSLVRTRSFPAKKDHRLYGWFGAPFRHCAVARAPG